MFDSSVNCNSVLFMYWLQNISFHHMDFCNLLGQAYGFYIGRLKQHCSYVQE